MSKKKKVYGREGQKCRKTRDRCVEDVQGTLGRLNLNVEKNGHLVKLIMNEERLRVEGKNLRGLLVLRACPGQSIGNWGGVDHNSEM